MDEIKQILLILDNGSGGTRVTFANNITYNPTTAGASTDIVSIVEIDALQTGHRI